MELMCLITLHSQIMRTTICSNETLIPVEENMLAIIDVYSESVIFMIIEGEF